MPEVTLTQGLAAAVELASIKQAPWEADRSWLATGDIRVMASRWGLWALLADCTGLLGPATPPTTFRVNFDQTMLDGQADKLGYKWAETGPGMRSNTIPWRPAPVDLHLSSAGNATITRKDGNNTKYLADADGHAAYAPVELVLTLLDKASADAVRAAGETALNRLEKLPLRVVFVRARLYEIVADRDKQFCRKAEPLLATLRQSLEGNRIGNPFDGSSTGGAVFDAELPEWTRDSRFAAVRYTPDGYDCIHVGYTGDN